MANAGEEMKSMIEQIQREQQERLNRINESISCGQVKNPYVPHGTCSIINKNMCMSSSPISSSKSISYLQPDTKPFSDMFEQLANENKKLTQEKIKLNLKVLELENRNYELIENYAKLKSYVETKKEKSEVWSDLNKNIKGIYLKIIDWFNS
jgi:hypothetical protein